MAIRKLSLFMLYAFLCQLAFSLSSSHLCPKDQALALLQFKQMFTTNAFAACSYSYPNTISWNRSTDCCSWGGVHCDEMTGKVIELDLSCSQLQGKLYSNSSLFRLSNLKRLDLSGNDFSGSLISPRFGEFSSLTHLDLSSSSFSGQIPSEISYLSKLYVLRINNEYELRLGTHNFELLLKNLTQLRELELASINISSTFPLNFSSYLTTLRLPYTQLYGTLPERVFHLPNLKSLELSYNSQLTVGFPTAKWNSSTSLTKLHLNSLNFTGDIPESFNYLTSLRELQMTSSNLSGPILKPLWNLTHIEHLDLSHNYLEGPISNFFRFGNIKELWLQNNNFNDQLEFLSFNRSWTQLEVLHFLSNFLTGPIPSNVSGLQNLELLLLSSNHLNGRIPSWIFCLPLLSNLDLSHNNFSGQIEELKSKNLFQISLGHNQLHGPIPKLLLNQKSLEFLLLPHNNLNGQIASSICNLTSLRNLDLRSNNLKGTIPQCLGEMSEFVRVLDISNNNLSGTIPTNFTIGSQLKSFRLHRNKLEGKIPQSLINCKHLEVLDLGNNELNDTYPQWLGTLPNLKILSLRSNKLHGPIKDSRNISLFKELQIMDLSSNGFSGNLPASLFENFEAMKIIDENMRTGRYIGDEYLLNYNYDVSLSIIVKGLDLKFHRVLIENMIINLSENRFEGYIPSSIGDLIALRVLNLSHNCLEGLIPTTLQHLSVLESLDLSFNKIDGGIPQQLASLTSLAVLNLSHNHLVGCIPKGQQFDTFDNSSYQQNDGLRGFPVSKDCRDDDGVAQATTPVVQDQGEGEDSAIISWHAVLMGYGCGLIIGLSIIYIMLSTQNPARMIEELVSSLISCWRWKYTPFLS
ncbi:receptor-like protein Cf-9 homolog isoform X1 [Nicotiana sylvestris]|uniref:Receptor-like protein 12 isoform X1 n=1 Tax=Nicotiana sylvestris TaxID=4096 RepID=A0A1U7XDG7_NICSY|nr:PREDICTED: receptor-like protein 12 isoform X1 [Nicotiana sylvestris]